MEAITLQHIDKSYTTYSTEVVLTGQSRQSRTRRVLKDLSVSFPTGQLSVIVGRSGCGKSTLLKLLAGMEQPDAGQILIPDGWHSAMLSPDPYVITWTDVQRNVAMACGVGKTPEERYEKASEFVDLVGLSDQLEEALLLGQKIIVMHPDSSIREFDLSHMPYPRDPDSPSIQQLKREITDECRRPSIQ